MNTNIKQFTWLMGRCVFGAVCGILLGWLFSIPLIYVYHLINSEERWLILLSITLAYLGGLCGFLVALFRPSPPWAVVIAIFATLIGSISIRLIDIEYFLEIAYYNVFTNNNMIIPQEKWNSLYLAMTIIPINIIIVPSI
jgi:hypothetical protein